MELHIVVMGGNYDVAVTFMAPLISQFTLQITVFIKSFSSCCLGRRTFWLCLLLSCVVSRGKKEELPQTGLADLKNYIITVSLSL